jgi:hypothetical protein
MSSRHMRLLLWAALRSDSEQVCSECSFYTRTNSVLIVVTYILYLLVRQKSIYIRCQSDHIASADFQIYQGLEQMPPS